MEEDEEEEDDREKLVMFVEARDIEGKSELVC